MSFIFKGEMKSLRLPHKWLRYLMLIIFGIVGVNFLSRFFYTFIFSQPENSREVVLSKAKEYLFNGYPEKAAGVYERMLVSDPNFSEAILNLAIIYDDYLEKNEKAVEFYKKFLELNSSKEMETLVREWMREAANQSLRGKENIGGESAYSKMKRQIKELLQENENLKKQVELLSGKLYRIEGEHQKEIEQLQAERDRLASELSSARIRIGKLLEELEASERARKELQKEIEVTEWDFDIDTTHSTE